ncbi:pectinesterase family protein [Pseudobacteroides cellulosolvens]|uniref:Pectinesterase n=1 Tax=Pseudobacteroides cellulosolvens ATCC 35603 = DSM 2933 TaxID=398512 RepID=A0A0L6JWT8_9FIRM|nr:pectinesterase family protein [Pseudobacteroides cellulosolvens]KNY29902.1 Pectinesterase [Pseudobacteroides cellulosolvens ATCC 35603 = DSM 2933]
MMKKFSALLCIMFCITIILPFNNINVSDAASPDIIVAKDGTGKFTTVQAAIDSVPANNTKQVIIYVKKGTYQEVVTIRKDNIYLIGESNTGTKITYGNYAGKLKADGTTYGTSGSASFYLYGKNSILENILIDNSFDENTNTAGKQAVAAYIQGDRNIIRNCVFTGNQDTLYANGGRQYYIDCKIVGDTDFIFGGATAVFDNCEIVSTVRGGYVTAASTDISNYGYLFLNCKLTSEAPANSTYLGRPWRPNAYVVYKTCYLGAHINKNGWTTMSGNLPENARFFEYKNTGPGALVNSSRRQLTDANALEFTPENLLKGTDNWNPVASVKPTSTPTVTLKPTPESGYSIYQAENASYNQAVYETKNAGYTGTGYINYDGVAGGYIEWSVNIPSSTIVRLNFRYANGTTNNRPMEIKVNGAAAVGSMNFYPTGSWTTWNVNSTDIYLTKGINTIRAASLTAEGGPNIDYMEVSEIKNTPTPSNYVSVDLNGDRIINMADLIILASTFNAVRGDGKYAEANDLNKDGAINMSDVIVIAAKFNSSI